MLGPFFPFFAPFPACARGRQRDDDGDGRLEDGETIENASQLSAPGYGARWNTGDMGNVGIGDEVFIEIRGGNIQTTSEWTIDNEPAGRIMKVGRSSDLSFNSSNSEVFVTFYCTAWSACLRPQRTPGRSRAGGA